MPSRAKKRATPSGFMMKGLMPLSGGSSTLKSGMSEPVHARPFHATSFLDGSNGLPFTSHDARLYSTRRFAGHAHAQPSVWPMPVGSELSRRPIWLPACVHEPQKIQQPLAVEPSSRSCAKLASCSPRFASTFV
jgi:hypothetical protein